MKKLIIANWKMQLSYPASIALAKKFVRDKRIAVSKNEVAVCPDHLSLAAVAAILKGSALRLGAQDAAPAARGAYTGEVSPADLKALGTKYVIIGHSERRRELNEDAVIIAAKVRSALARRLIPIMCLGESLSDKKKSKTRHYLDQELRCLLGGLKLKAAGDLVIAYEPVWAISTVSGAHPLSPVEAGAIHGYIKAQAAKITGKNLRVIYGGSADEINAAAFLKQDAIDGLLVGGASLELARFRAMC